MPSNEAQASPHTAAAVGAVTKSYSYDPAGNRKTLAVGSQVTSYTYNSASQLTTEDTPSAPSVSHLYDQWGNESTRTTSGVTETYLYNYLNLLSSYTKGSTVSEQYDFWPTGERYAKRNLLTPSDQELYVPRFGDVATEYSTATVLKNSYVQGTGVDSKCTRIAANGDRWHYLGDQVGTVSMTLSDTAAVTESNLKDVWGVAMTTAASSERYGFAQREQDTESGLVYMRARMYDPRLGRFTQSEPISLNKSLFHFSYAWNNPASVTDPLGLQGEPDFVRRSLERLQTRAAAGQVPTPVQQLEQWAATLDYNPAQVSPDYLALASNLERDRGAMSASLLMPLEDLYRREAIAGLRRGDPEPYYRYRQYGQRNLDFAIGLANMAVGGMALTGTIAEEIGTSLHKASSATVEGEAAVAEGSAESQTTAARRSVASEEATNRSSTPAEQKSSGAASVHDETFARNRRFEPSPKHPDVQSAQNALDFSFRVSGNSPRRVGIDRATGRILVFDRTGNLVQNKEAVGGVYHGHYRTWDELTPAMRNVLKENGIKVDSRGRIQIDESKWGR